MKSRTQFSVVFAATGCLALSATLALSAGCASYVTPGGPASFTAMTDGDIAERYKREPLAQFPAAIAVARVQAPGYRSSTSEGFGQGKYTVVTTRDIEDPNAFERIAKLGQVRGLAPLNRLLVPRELHSDRELRVAAASLKADMLLVYTVDTTFWIDQRDIGPLGLITLGFVPINEARVTSTAAAALFDVRSGYVYALAEGTARQTYPGSAWSSHDSVERARREAERKAFIELVANFEQAWPRVVAEYGNRTPGATATAARP